MADDRKHDDTDREDLDQALQALEELLSGASRERRRVPAAEDAAQPGPGFPDPGSARTAQTGGHTAEADATTDTDGIPLLTEAVYLPEHSPRWPRPDTPQPGNEATEHAAPRSRRVPLPGSPAAFGGTAIRPAAGEPAGPPADPVPARPQSDVGRAGAGRSAQSESPAPAVPAVQPAPAAPAPRQVVRLPERRIDPAPAMPDPVDTTPPPAAEPHPLPPTAETPAPSRAPEAPPPVRTGAPPGARGEPPIEPEDPAIEWFGTSHLAPASIASSGASDRDAETRDAASTAGAALAGRLVDALADEFRHIMRRELHPDVIARMRVVAARMLRQWSQESGDRSGPDDSV